MSSRTAFRAFPTFVAVLSLPSIEDVDYGPTRPQFEVFKILSGRLAEQLKNRAQLKADEVPKTAALIKQMGLPAISVGGKPGAET